MKIFIVCIYAFAGLLALGLVGTISYSIGYQAAQRQLAMDLSSGVSGQLPLTNGGVVDSGISSKTITAEVAKGTTVIPVTSVTIDGQPITIRQGECMKIESKGDHYDTSKCDAKHVIIGSPVSGQAGFETITPKDIKP